MRQSMNQRVNGSRMCRSDPSGEERGKEMGNMENPEVSA